MKYSYNIRARANNYRRNGYSFSEIAEKLHISRSTASIWTTNQALSPKGKKRLQIRSITGRQNGLLSIKNNYRDSITKIDNVAKEVVDRLNLDVQTTKLLCAIFIWTEGGKSLKNSVKFINSDPLMIRTFLYLLRKAFPLDEMKFRALIHRPNYHNEPHLLNYWCKQTGITASQFHKSYLKPHTHKRKRANYNGCICISYFDYKIARELHSIYNMFAKSLGV